MRFYHITESEIDDIFNTKYHSYKDMEAALTWIEYRKKYPFRSWCIYLIGNIIRIWPSWGKI